MIPVVYCGNSKVFEGIFLSTISIASRTKKDIEFHLFTIDYQKNNKDNKPLTEEQRATIERGIQTFNPQNKVILHDLTDLFIKHFEGGKNLQNDYTPYAFLRLFMDEILPYQKAIYLDVDTMCLKDIDELFSVDIEDYEFAAGLDYMGRFWINPKYFNSGVLVINLDKVRETKLFKYCRKLIYCHYLRMPDQTSLFLMGKKVKLLERKYNEQRNIRSDTIIKHFNKGIKYFPFFKIYNIKQWQKEAVQKKLKIHDFDEDYAFLERFLKDEK